MQRFDIEVSGNELYSDGISEVEEDKKLNAQHTVEEAMSKCLSLSSEGTL